VKADFRLIHMPRRLRQGGWRTLLRRWADLLDDYGSAERGQQRDYASWYGERPLTGLLASAAWRLTDGWGLEEFASPRGSGSRARVGRGDLWLGTNGGRYTVEAKITWASRDWTVAKSYVLRRLAQARKQLRSLHRDYRYGDLVALCYVVPQPSATRSASRVADALFKNLPAYFADDPYLVATYRCVGREVPSQGV
jgi:hypothetical protein